MANNRITKELGWKEMKETFTIGTVKFKGELIKVNELQDAIEAGEIKEMLQRCADELHDGDFASAVKAYRRTLQSQGCNMRSGKVAHTNTDLVRYELLENYTKQFVTTTSTAVIEGKAKWQYTLEDIESLAGNHEELRKLYNSMMDKLSKDPEAIVEYFNRNLAWSKEPGLDSMEADFFVALETKSAMLDYRAKVERVRVLRNEAKDPVNKVSDNIVAKLQAGKKLTAEENAELLKLLGK